MSRYLTLLAMTVMASLAVNIFTLLAVLRLEALDVPLWFFSVFSASGYLALLLVTFVLPGVMGRLAPFALFALSFVGIAIAYGILAAAPVAALFLLARFVFSSAFTIKWGVGESWLNVRWPSASLGRAMSVYMVAWYAPLVAAPLIVGAFTQQTQLLAWVCAGAALSTLLLLAPWKSEPALPSERPHLHPYSFAHAPYAAAFGVLAGGLESARAQLFPVYLSRLGLGEAEVINGVLYLSLGAIPAVLLASWLADRLKPEAALAIIATLGALFTFGLLGDSGTGSLWFYFLLGGAANAVYPFVTIMVGRYVAPANRVEANASVILAYTLGGLCIPFLITLLMSSQGPQGFMIVCLGLFATLAGGLGLRHFSQKGE
jgi:MFS family permease